MNVIAFVSVGQIGKGSTQTRYTAFIFAASRVKRCVSVAGQKRRMEVHRNINVTTTARGAQDCRIYTTECKSLARL